MSNPRVGPGATKQPAADSVGLVVALYVKAKRTNVLRNFCLSRPLLERPLPGDVFANILNAEGADVLYPSPCALAFEHADEATEQ